MSVRILLAKLQQPPLRPDSVVRPHLISRLSEGVYRRFSLLSAPTGFGKTTLVKSWLAEQSQPVAWLSLDKADNTLLRFLVYLVSAFTTANPGVENDLLELVNQQDLSQAENILTDVLNEIEELFPYTILVLDDYHVIQDPVIHEAVRFLINNHSVGVPSSPAPKKGFHPVLITRNDPPFPLSRWRLHNEITEIRAEDLRFSEEEAAAFFLQTTKLNLTADQVRTLANQTEGWVAGLQLAALSMSNHPDETVDRFLHDFNGTNHLVSDYLMEEVVSQQSAENQAFLIETSILDHLSASLCDAVRERSDSQEILQTLEQLNLFILPLDEQRGWYRYHRLLSDVLTTHLRSLPAQKMKTLHARAAAWYEANGYIEYSLRHWLAAGEVDQAARLMMIMSPQLLSDGQFVLLHEAFNSFPEYVFSQWPWMNVYRAWTYYLYRSEPVDKMLRQAEKTVEEQSANFSQAGKDRILGEILALRTLDTVEVGDHQTTLELAPQALALLRDDAPRVRGLVMDATAEALYMEGRLDESLDTFIQASVELRQGENLGGSVNCLRQAGDIFLIQGKLQAAYDLLRKSIDISSVDARMDPSMASYSYTGIGEVFFERNQVEEAFRYFHQGMRLCRRNGKKIQIMSAIALANAYRNCGELERARETLEEFERFPGLQTLHPQVMSNWVACRLRLFSALGDTAAARQLIEERDLCGCPPSGSIREIETMALVDYYLIQGNIRLAETLLARLDAEMSAGQRHGRLIRVLAQRAVLQKKLGNLPAAMQILGRALTAGAQEGYQRTFVEFGDPMLALLVDLTRGAEQASPYTGDPAYPKQLIAALINSQTAGKNQPVRQKISDQSAVPDVLENPLTCQEEKILRLMMAGLNNTEIAAELTVSHNTIKTHVTNIFNKLGVHNRVQAVTRAKLLAILK